MKKLILSIALILIGIINPIVIYILYCNLLTTFNCNEEGLATSCVFTALFSTIFFFVLGVLLLDQSLDELKNNNKQ